MRCFTYQGKMLIKICQIKFGQHSSIYKWTKNLNKCNLKIAKTLKIIKSLKLLPPDKM